MLFLRNPKKVLVFAFLACFAVCGSVHAAKPVDYAKYQNESIGTLPISIDKEGKVRVLMGLRQPNDRPMGMLAWDWLGGVPSEKEGDKTPLDTLVREVSEEAGPAVEDMLVCKDPTSQHIALFNEVNKKNIWLVLKLVPADLADELIAAGNKYGGAKDAEIRGTIRTAEKEASREPSEKDKDSFKDKVGDSYMVKFDWVPVEYLDALVVNANIGKAAEGKFMANMDTAAAKTVHNGYAVRKFLAIIATNPAFKLWFDEAKKGLVDTEKFSHILPQE